MKKWACLMLAVLVTRSVMAFPTWMGTYGLYKKHDDRANPGLFSIMMNQDYVGLQAEVGIKVNDGSWVLYPMQYAGHVEGNSLWTFMPSFQFPAGAAVQYFFHGFDDWGGRIWDSRNGLNYEFTVSANPETVIQRIDAGSWNGETFANGITASTEKNIWVDFKVKNFGDPDMIGMVWTWNDWADHRSATASFEADLGSGYQQWGVDLAPAGMTYTHRSLGLIRWYIGDTAEYIDISGGVEIKYALFYVVNGTWYWDTNGGEDYSIVFGNPPSDPNDTDGDGLLDTWETAHFGSLVQGAYDNPDGDGAFGFPIVNIIEQVLGLNPHVPNDPMGVRLLWNDAYPVQGGTVTLSYGMGNEGNPLFGKPVFAHVGHNGWQGVYRTAQLTANGANGRFEITIDVPAGATEINVVFTDGNGTWDNNGGSDWNIPVRK